MDKRIKKRRSYKKGIILELFAGVQRRGWKRRGGSACCSGSAGCESMCHPLPRCLLVKGLGKGGKEMNVFILLIIIVLALFKKMAD